MPLTSSAQAPMDDDEFFNFVKDDFSHGALELPMLPITAMRVFRLASDPGAAVTSLVAMIEADQKLAIEVIRLANSAAYAGQTTIASVHYAATRLGLGNLAEIAVAAGFRAKVFDQDEYLDLMFEHWQSSLMTALWSRQLAVQYGGDQASAYLCGLLHNIATPIAVKIVVEWAQEHRRAEHDQILRAAARMEPLVSERLRQEWEVPEVVGLLWQRSYDHQALDDDPPEIAATHLARHLTECMQDPDEQGWEQIAEHPAGTCLGLGDEALTTLWQQRQAIAAEAESLSSL